MMPELAATDAKRAVACAYVVLQMQYMLSRRQAVPCIPDALFVHYHAVSSLLKSLHHNPGIPAIGHPEVQGSEGGGGAPCQQVPAVWHRIVCVRPYLMKPHVLMHGCMDLLPFRLCSYCLHTWIFTD